MLRINVHEPCDTPTAGAATAEAGFLSSPSSLGAAGRLNVADVVSSAGGASRPGGSAAFLDINYGKSVADQVGGVERPGGSAAFLDINYGKSVADQVGQVARPGGSAAFLDINYGKAVADQVGQVAQPGMESSAAPSSGSPGLSLYFVDGHLYLVE